MDYQLGVTDTRAALAEASARTFMARVYRWMFIGLALSAIVAVEVAATPVLARAAVQFFWPSFIVELVLVFALSRAAPKLGGPAAATLYLLYAALNGFTLSIIFFMYKLGSIVNVFAVTSLAFLALSLYGTYTKRNLDAWRSFLYFGLFGVVIATVVNIFMHSSAMEFVLSCCGVIVFGGLTAYDTQKLRSFHAQSGYGSVQSLAVVGALTLYLDFINLFLELLQLFGGSRD